MSFASLLVHELVIRRTPMDDTLENRDSYGNPVAGTPVETTVRGMVQPKSARELSDYRGAGVEVGTHTIYLAPMDLDGADAITYAGDDYQITGVRSLAYGSVPHLEVDATRIGPHLEADEAEGS